MMISDGFEAPLRKYICSETTPNDDRQYRFQNSKKNSFSQYSTMKTIMFKYVRVFVAIAVMLCAHLVAAKKCKSLSEKTVVPYDDAEPFYGYIFATDDLSKSGSPTWNPLKSKFKSVFKDCQKTCESSRRCKAWLAGKLKNGTEDVVECDLFSKGTFKLKKGKTPCPKGGKESKCMAGAC